MRFTIDEAGHKVAVAPSIIFTNKQRIDWKDVKSYLQRYVGMVVEVEETKDLIHIGNVFPSEYGGSTYTRSLKGGRAKAKANAVQVIVEMLKIASERTYSVNMKQKHANDAAYGWYYYNTRFALPVYDNKEKTENLNVYTACLVVNHAANGKRYLYDVLDIKKEACNPLKTDRTSDI